MSLKFWGEPRSIRLWTKITWVQFEAFWSQVLDLKRNLNITIQGTKVGVCKGVETKTKKMESQN